MRRITRAHSRADQTPSRTARLLSGVLALAMSFSAFAGPVRAWSWSPAASTYARNITGMVRIYPDAKPADVARQLNALPAGQRVLCMLGFTERLASHPGDVCRKVDAQGRTTLTSFPGPWCTAGEAEVKTGVERFLDGLKAAGATVIDAVVLDNETTFWAGRYVTADGANTAAIEADPRFPALAKRLGFSKLKGLAWGGAEYLRWNEVVQADFDQALNRAVAVPVRLRWPTAIVCNYGSAPIRRDCMTPDMSGLGMVYGGNGFGTHNSLSYYGNSLQWIRGRVFAGTTLNDGAFDMFRMNVHRMRATGATTNRAMLPWIAACSLGLNGEAQQPGSDLAGYFSPLASTKYWDENVIQLVMHGSDTLMLFNPAAWRKDQNAAVWNRVDDQARLSNLIDDLNGRLGGNAGASRWFSLPGLQDRVMATGRRVSGGTLWRFSFAPGVASVVVALKNGDVREILPEQGGVGAWYFEADAQPLAVKKDGTDIAWAEASLGSAWADFDDNGTVDQGDLALLMMEIGGDDATFDMNGDGRVTQADATAFQALRRDWASRATLASPVRPGSVLVSAAR